MNFCSKCQSECLSLILPERHIAKFGVIAHSDKTIFVYKLDFHKLIKAWLEKRTICRWWIGSDVLLLRMFPPGRGKLSVIKHRIEAFLTEPLIDEHWIYGEILFEEFKQCWSPRKAKLKLCTSTIEVVPKVPHDGLNIAYYYPKDDVFSRWVYGIDIIEQVIAKYSQINWIKLDGTLNPKYFFQMLDAYIRPSRSDGSPRLIAECQANGISYYWSENRNPNFEETCKFIESLM